MASGRVTGLWRYPVKSMMGEAVSAADLTANGLAGDRRFAVLDEETGRVASAKRPVIWGTMLHCRARYLGDPIANAPIEMALADGSTVRSDEADVDARLSGVLGRRVRLVRGARQEAICDADLSDIPGVTPPDWLELAPPSGASGERLTAFRLPTNFAGAFFDSSPIHLVSDASLDTIATTSRSEAVIERIRPNILLDIHGQRGGFPEDEWLQRSLTIGSARLVPSRWASRCIVPTLEQAGVSADAALMREIVRRNTKLQPFADRPRPVPCLGIYATVAAPGRLAVGMSFTIAADALAPEEERA